MTIALSSLVNDYVQSASDSDDSEPTPLGAMGSGTFAPLFYPAEQIPVS